MGSLLQRFVAGRTPSEWISELALLAAVWLSGYAIGRLVELRKARTQYREMRRLCDD